MALNRLGSRPFWWRTRTKVQGKGGGMERMGKEGGLFPLETDVAADLTPKHQYTWSCLPSVRCGGATARRPRDARFLLLRDARRPQGTSARR